MLTEIIQLLINHTVCVYTMLKYGTYAAKRAKTKSYVVLSHTRKMDWYLVDVLTNRVVEKLLNN